MLARGRFLRLQMRGDEKLKEGASGANPEETMRRVMFKINITWCQKWDTEEPTTKEQQPPSLSEVPTLEPSVLFASTSCPNFQFDCYSLECHSCYGED
ncbi:WD repeat-containing protein 89 isoform X6 [Equus caballus]|uniref:WD repeat-containing protein 89 isoform X6 n=2 Tax=Equus caballus TaxID=9796 RepID=UPI0038B32DA3